MIVTVFWVVLKPGNETGRNESLLVAKERTSRFGDDLMCISAADTFRLPVSMFTLTVNSSPGLRLLLLADRESAGASEALERLRDTAILERSGLNMK